MSSPGVTCVFRQTTPLECDQRLLANNLQFYASTLLAVAWNTDCTVYVADRILPGTWGLIFTDNADQAGALGYHDATPEGLPLGHVFVATAARAGEHVATVASHELAELLIDPGANLGAFSPRGRWVALEVCDPVERVTFDVNGLPMSDFVYPAWFGQGPADGKWDHAGECHRPWHILPGGYVPVWVNGKWSQLFGSFQAMESFACEDRRLKRSHRRAAKAPREGWADFLTHLA